MAPQRQAAAAIMPLELLAFRRAFTLTAEFLASFPVQTFGVRLSGTLD
jgi:hypothetical protein